MTKHGFKFLYNWIWKKNSIPNFASMKYRPGNNYEEIMIFSKGNKRVTYYPHAEFNGEVKTKCKFYNYKTRTPISSEEVFDKYFIPYLLGNAFNEDIKILTTNKSIVGANSNVGFAGKGLNEILNDDIRVIGKSNQSNAISDVTTVTHIKLDQIFKEKYQDQFEIDFEKKELYRTVKTYRNYPTAVIDVKYANSVNKKWKKHPTAKPVEVLEYLIEHYTNEGDTILDFTMGSGSTGVACKNMNRNFIGIEISKVWYDVAQLRINDV